MSFVAGQRIRASDMNGLVPQGDVGTYAEYNTASNQSFTSGTQAVVLFGTTNLTSTLVTRATDGAGHRFTLGRAGLWVISATIRWVSDSGGERYSTITSSDGGVASQSDILAAGTTAAVTSNLSICRYFNLSAWVRVECYQNAGGNRSLESNNASGWGRINLAWIHA